jgi:hypothetical protein
MKKHGERRWKLTGPVQAAVCDFIRAGGFPQVAAEAAGVPGEVFAAWLKRGEAGRVTAHNRRYFELRQAVMQAEAQARLAAEIKVHETTPLAWLRQGPGRETAGNPGWTQAGGPSTWERRLCGRWQNAGQRQGKTEVEFRTHFHFFDCLNCGE